MLENFGFTIEKLGKRSIDSPITMSTVQGYMSANYVTDDKSVWLNRGLRICRPPSRTGCSQARVLDDIHTAGSVPLIPPDITRFQSKTGFLTGIAYREPAKRYAQRGKLRQEI